MKSYDAEETDADYEDCKTVYPSLFLQRSIISPMDAPQDKPCKKRKRSLLNIANDDKSTHNYGVVGESEVRKFHKKF